MHDKVLGFLRETMLHENEVESLSIDLAVGHLKLTLLQPNEESSWPDHELILTFSGVREISARSIGRGRAGRCDVLSIECMVADEDLYRVEISVGGADKATSSILLVFSDLHYQRS